MATLRRKKAEPFSVFQRDPGPWPPILLNWMATLAIIMVFGLVMLFSASYTTGYLRFGDSFHYIKSQLLCTVLGLGMMFLFSYFDHRFLRRMVKLGYVVCLILLVLVLFTFLQPLLPNQFDPHQRLPPVDQLRRPDLTGFRGGKV